MVRDEPRDPQGEARRLPKLVYEVVELPATLGSVAEARAEVFGVVDLAGAFGHASRRCSEEPQNRQRPRSRRRCFSDAVNLPSGPIMPPRLEAGETERLSSFPEFEFDVIELPEVEEEEIGAEPKEVEEDEGGNRRRDSRALSSFRSQNR